MISYEQYIKSIRVYLASLPVGKQVTPADIQAEYLLADHNRNDDQPSNFQLISAIQMVLGWYERGRIYDAIPEYPGKPAYAEYIQFVPSKRKLVCIQRYPPYEASDRNSYPNLQDVYQVQ